MGDPWFRPKAIGVGYTPANAKGWLSLLVFVVLLAATVVLTSDPSQAHPPSAAEGLAHLKAELGLGGVQLTLPGRVLAVGAEIVVFALFAWWKSGPRPEPPATLD
ncbi:hypothetical protein [Phenylobacterium sp.]|jgi:hypothetical protein|uniref:hypothetical protein n=1 Tax=Phenylobacterium sp. TaxID=1871053 RepID=UPI002F3E83F2